MEFIPSTDKDPYKWSQIITIIPFIGKGLSAKQIVENLVSIIGQKNKSAKILDSTYSNKDEVGMANALISYTEKGREELLEVYAISGPYDSTLIQNAVPVTLYGSTESARKKLDEFFHKNISIIDGDKAVE